MTTAVQTSYRPQMRPAVPGQIADMTGTDRITRIAEGAMGFGLAVSKGANSDKGCVLGGSAFLGITIRDITLVPGISIDPLYSGSPVIAPDQFSTFINVPVMTRGRIWVVAGAKVAAGDALFYSVANGGFSNSASGQAAIGSIAFTQQPAVGQTITLQGSAWTCVASGATGLQFNQGPTLGDTIAGLAAVLNASADTNTTLLSYEAYPPSPGGSAQGSGSNTLNVASKAVGTAGNAYTLATNVTGATVSGATLSGGTAAATAVPSGFWVNSTSVAGDLSVVSLAIQR